MHRASFLKVIITGLSVMAVASGLYAEDRATDRETPFMMGEGSAPTANTVDYQLWDVPGRSGQLALAQAGGVGGRWRWWRSSILMCLLER